jgi:hypothetical protein
MRSTLCAYRATRSPLLSMARSSLFKPSTAARTYWMIVDCGERMLRMLQIAQRRLQVLSDPRASLLSHTDAAPLVIYSDIRRAGRCDGYAKFICVNGQMGPIIRSQATSFGATMKGRTGGFESEGSPEGLVFPLSHRVGGARDGAAAYPALLQSVLPL